MLLACLSRLSLFLFFLFGLWLNYLSKRNMNVLLHKVTEKPHEWSRLGNRIWFFVFISVHIGWYFRTNLTHLVTILLILYSVYYACCCCCWWYVALHKQIHKLTVEISAYLCAQKRNFLGILRHSLQLRICSMYYFLSIWLFSVKFDNLILRFVVVVSVVWFGFVW